MNVYLKDSVFTTRIDTSENWAAANPVLYRGERGIDSTEGKEKVGDGVTAWNDLPWFGGGSAPAAEVWEPVFQRLLTLTQQLIKLGSSPSLAEKLGCAWQWLGALPTLPLATNRCI